MRRREELFKTAEDIEQEKKEKLIKEGGIYYFEKEEPETGERKRYVNILGIEIETEATKEDIDKIKKKLLMSELDQEILRKMAECYVLRQPMMLEGPPGAGKTFLIEYFTKLLYGYGAIPLRIYGTTRTDAEDILGNWIPKTASEEEKEIWDDFLKSKEGKEKLEELAKDAEEIVKRTEGKGLSREQRIEILQNNFESKLAELAKSIGLRSLSEFKFREGPLLKAYTLFGGKGYILDVEELGVMPTNVQETFLQIGGESGELAKEIQHSGNSRQFYQRGERTGVFFSSNPTEVGARHVTTTPMASRLVWIRISEEKVRAKESDFIEFYCTRDAEEEHKKPELKVENLFIPVEKPIHFTAHRELGSTIAKAIETFHTLFLDWYKKIGEPDREQKFEISMREMTRVVNYVSRFQYRGEDGEIDLTISLKRAIELYYVDRLADEATKEEMKKLFEAILGQGSSKLLKKGAPMIEGKTIAEKIKEEIENLNPEKRREKALEKLKEVEERIYKVPVKYKNWKNIEEFVTEYNQGLKEVARLKKRGEEEDDPEKGAEFLEQAKNKLEELEKLASQIKKQIEERERLEEEIKNIKSTLKEKE